MSRAEISPFGFLNAIFERPKFSAQTGRAFPIWLYVLSNRNRFKILIFFGLEVQLFVEEGDWTER